MDNYSCIYNYTVYESVYLTSVTQGVVAESPEPEAHDINARQIEIITKDKLYIHKTK